MSDYGFFVGPASPPTPIANKTAWYDTSTGALKVWTGAQWDGFTTYHIDFAMPSEGGTGVDTSGSTGQVELLSGSNWLVVHNWLHVARYGATCDGSTDDSQAVMDALTAAAAMSPPINVYIPPGTVWDYTADPGDLLGTIQSRHPDEVAILDESGWDWAAAAPRFSGIRQILLKTDDPGNANANALRIGADWHPNLIINNLSDASDAELNAGTKSGRGSLLFKRDNESRWILGLDNGQNVIDDFRIWSRIDTPTSEIAHLTILYDHADPRVSFGYGRLAPAAYPYVFYNPGDARTLFVAWVSNANGGANDQHVAHEYFAGAIGAGTRLYKQVIYASGANGKGAVYEYDQNNALRRGITADFEEFGDRRLVTAATGNYSVSSASESGKFFTNEGTAGGFTFTLPAAVKGLHYRFTVLETQNMRIDPNGSEIFRGKAAGKYMQSSTIGEWLYVWCAQAGVWEYQRSTTWTDE